MSKQNELLKGQTLYLKRNDINPFNSQNLLFNKK